MRFDQGTSSDSNLELDIGSASSTPSSEPRAKIARLTRSQTVPYNSENCFFFVMGKVLVALPLHKVATRIAGKNLSDAIRKCKDDKLAIKLSTAIDPIDAHAIDIRYHKKCWTDNVAHVLRTDEKAPNDHLNDADAGAEVEFLSLVEKLLSTGQILSTADLQKTYENI